MHQPGGFDFLGYHFERGYRWPRAKSLQKLKATLRTKPDAPTARACRHHRGRQSHRPGLV